MTLLARLLSFLPAAHRIGLRGVRARRAQRRAATGRLRTGRLIARLERAAMRGSYPAANRLAGIAQAALEERRLAEAALARLRERNTRLT